MLRIREKYSPGSCEYKGQIQEIRWDLSGCNLRCLFCWSPASQPEETGDNTVSLRPTDLAKRTVSTINDPSKAFIRFTGGEPTLQWPEVESALAALRQLNPARKPPILYQTNGIEIGRGSVDFAELALDRNQLYLFEVSFKGTNPSEFALLTGKSPDLYELQLAGYKRLLEFSRANNNVSVVAVLGVYHSSTSGPSKYAFVAPETGYFLFDDQQKWDSEFAAIWNAASLKWVERLRMSPPGLWKNVLSRCGPHATGLVMHFPQGASTNPRSLFPAKPPPAQYVQKIVEMHFWPTSVIRALPKWERKDTWQPAVDEQNTATTTPVPMPGAIHNGSTVTLADGTKYKIGVDVSLRSPIGTALIGRRAGDVVTVKTPSGFHELRIVNVQ
jgi:uncharacterized Fe-S cluster-containing radical SAM superfamily protein